MKAVFRTDASLAMGSGHVMRCLTLADALKARGSDCRFICRPHAGHLLDLIRRRGHAALALPAPEPAPSAEASPYAAWLGGSWQDDAEQTAALLDDGAADWLIVDHYALDARWENALRSRCRQLLALDDLADRPHDCDLLLDQNLGRQDSDYAGLTPAHCERLTGPAYALLRPEFAALRDVSLARRQAPALRHILVSMGGMDQPNATGAVLQALQTTPLPSDCRLTVVMGAGAPWLEQVRELAARLGIPARVAVNVNDMARLMADCDVAIGAAGGTAWERCCLGVPTAVAVLADNQRAIAESLAAAGVGVLLGTVAEIAGRLPVALSLLGDPGKLADMSARAGRLTDGQGSLRVLEKMVGRHE